MSELDVFVEGGGTSAVASPVTFNSEIFGVSGVRVTLATKTKGAVIHYTTDGAEPTEESDIYSAPLTFTSDAVVKAIAVKSGMATSGVSVFNVKTGGFIVVQGKTITGTEAWIPESQVFVSGRFLKIPTLLVCDHEVTRGEYKGVMGIDPSTAKAYDGNGNELSGDAVLDNPVDSVSFYDAVVYCNRRSIQENLTPCYSIDSSTDPDEWGEVPTDSGGDDRWSAVACNFSAEGYRLPTEAEWEYLARGEEGYTYAGSNNIDEVAWYGDNTNGTRTVKTKKANAYGLYDMSGNVGEWCWDSYKEITNMTPEFGPGSGGERLFRGGFWTDSYEEIFQVCDRYFISPNTDQERCGFRVVRSCPM